MATKLLNSLHWLLIFTLLTAGCLHQYTFTPIPTATFPPTPLPSPSPEATPPQEISLVVWLPDELFLKGKPGRKALEEEIEAFERNHPLVEVKVYIKKARGEGGILALLLSAREVAPSVLPDLVVLDAAEAACVDGDFFQPLGEIPESLFPFASSGFIYLAADLDHMVYNTGVVTSPPLSWEEIKRGGGLLLPPSGGMVAAQYFTMGGRFRNERSELILEEEILAKVLKLWKENMEKGAIPTPSRKLEDPEEMWKKYLYGKVAMVGVRASLFLASRERLHQTAFAPLPSAAPVAWGWVAGVISREHERKKAAEALVKWLLLPERNQRWTLAANLLPVHREAYAQEEDAYLLFLSRLLESAYPAPPSTLLKLLEEALRNVLEGKATPEEAAHKAAKAIPQLYPDALEKRTKRW
ncbi:MAG: hypothetical protein RMK30_02175 [Anaerolineae bacterium]|nr:hypothetical protein [Anaerolineae bacterium]